MAEDRVALADVRKRIRDSLWESPADTGLAGIPTDQANTIIGWFAQRELEQLTVSHFLIRAADRLAAAVAHRISMRRLDARSEAGDALLDYDSLVDYRTELGLEPREGRIGG